MDLCNPKEIKALLGRHGFHFSKSKGQNFLIQSWVPQQAAEASGAAPGVGVLEIGPNSINPHGNVHGGALATLADTVGGCCACSRGGVCVTASSSMEFLRPANGSMITCIATPKKLGRTLAVVQTDLFNDSEKLVATGTFTFFMVEPPTE